MRRSNQNENLQNKHTLPRWPHLCDLRPYPLSTHIRIIERFATWASSHSLEVLGFGTACGAIELRMILSAHFDYYKQSNVSKAPLNRPSIFVIGGYSSVKTLKRIIKSYEQIKRPKFVIALGSNSSSGQRPKGKRNLKCRIDQYIPVDVHIADCWPTQRKLIAGFLQLKLLIQNAQNESESKYYDNFNWYKNNQKKVIKDLNIPELNKCYL
ncbi:MAG: NADH-quinone oxidoreductase subunit B [Bacteriovoracaceae bacterium]|nr:NADH-quinone oxidoreductase subunit B [Bacteriovoracaceae bacterium]